MPAIESLPFLLAAAYVAAALLHAAFGFGAALVAMPLAAALLPLTTATPVTALFMVTTALVMLSRSWANIDFRSTLRLLVATAFGLPLGLYLLREAPEGLVRALLGVVLIGYGFYGLVRPELRAIRSNAWAYGLGFFAGILGGAYNANGPPVVLYGTMRRWPPDQFRATLQSYFVPTTVLICLSHAATGLWTREVFELYVFTLPFFVPAVLVGLWIGRKIPAQKFQRALHAALLVLGASLLI